MPESRTKGYLVRHSSAADSLLFFSARLLPVSCHSLAVGCTAANTSRKIAAHGNQNFFQVEEHAQQLLWNRVYFCHDRTRGNLTNAEEDFLRLGANKLQGPSPANPPRQAMENGGACALRV